MSPKVKATLIPQKFTWSPSKTNAFQKNISIVESKTKYPTITITYTIIDYNKICGTLPGGKPININRNDEIGRQKF